jgi:putative abortive phage resistance protein
MLRVLHLDNWKCFSEPVDFTMIAGKESRHGETLYLGSKNRVLPVAAIYGANAAGKSTLLDALAHLQVMLREPRKRGQRLHYHPHLLFGANRPSVIGVEIVLDVQDATSNRKAIVYYEVAFNAGEIVEESLYRVRSEDEQAVFERRGQEVSLYGDLEDDVSLDAASKTVQPNRLFLETCFNAGFIDGEKSLLGSVIEWFKRLTILKRGARYILMPQQIAHDDAFRAAVGQGLTVADTGISGICYTSVPRDKVPAQDKVLEEIEDQLTDKTSEAYLTAESGAVFRARLGDDGDVVYERLVTVHKDGAHEFRLPLEQESDGSIRYLNLLPILYWAGKRQHSGVYLIDELEDSLHPKLTEELIRLFLDASGPDEQRQLIFTTHELHLLRVDLLRRDEIWLVEKNDHRSELTRLTDFPSSEIRSGSDLQRMYMSGRLGGVPRL